MRPANPGSRRTARLLIACLVGLSLPVASALGADYGRLSGKVSDSHGNPLMGATVMIIGPTSATASLGDQIERVITDAGGRFAVEHLIPGWYSLRVSAPTLVPILRKGIRVEAGTTASETFVLTDIFAPLRFQIPNHSVTSWGDDWKWVLRTSPTTRPILRFQEAIAQNEPKLKPPRAASQRMIGMLPGSARRDPLSDDPGLGSVLAYLRPLSDDSDLLVVGSMAATGIQSSIVATALRRNLVKGNPQELTLVVHQMNFADGVSLPPGNSSDPLGHAQGIVATYSQTRHLTSRITVTAGMEVNYLNAARDAMTTQPRIRMDYLVNGDTNVAVQYGSGRSDGSQTFLERVGMLNAFPRVTLRNYRPQLEQLNHAEVSMQRRLGGSSRLELAAYHDTLHNAVVWGTGSFSSSSWLDGNFLPNPLANGVALNAGNYQSTGFRAAYRRTFGNNVEALVAYSTGSALMAEALPRRGAQEQFQDVLHPARSNSISGRVSARLPATRTQIITSYGWVPYGRVTMVDPYGQASLDLQPYLGVQIRQPLPTLAFLPAHIEALADFRNLVDEGNVPMSRSGEKPLLVSSSYRCFRGGFSVQF